MKRSVLLGGIAVVVLGAVGVGYGIVLPRVSQAMLDRNIAAWRANLPPGATLTYDHAVAHGLQRSVSFDNLVYRQADGSTFAAAHLDAAPEGPHRLRRVHATGVKFHEVSGDRVTDVEIGELEAHDLRSDAQAIVTPSAPPASQDTPADRRNAALQHVAVGDLDASKLTLTLPVSIDQQGLSGGRRISITATDLHLSDFGPGCSSDLVAHGLSLPDGDYSMSRPLPNVGVSTRRVRHINVSTEAVELRNMRLADLIAARAAGHPELERKFGPPSGIDVEHLKVIVRDGDAPGREVGIGRIHLEGHGTAPLTSSDLTADDIVLPGDELGKIMPGVFTDGRAHGQVVARGHGNQDTGAFDLEAMQVSFEHVGTLRIAIAGQVDPAFATSNTNAKDVLAHTTLASGEIGIADGGLREALLNLTAKRGNTTPQAFATLLAGRIQGGLAMLGDAGARIAPALATFIEKGGAVTISTHPAKPLLLSSLDAHTPDARIGLLTSLNIEAKQSDALPPLPPLPPAPH